MAIYRLVGADGAAMFFENDFDAPEGAVEVERFPGPYEDFVDGEWVYQSIAHANELAGPKHIAEAHLTKYMEALLVKSGVTLTTGLLAAEARLQGVAVADIADAVMVKRAEFIAKETTRQEAQLSEPTPEA